MTHPSFQPMLSNTQTPILTSESSPPRSIAVARQEEASVLPRSMETTSDTFQPSMKPSSPTVVVLAPSSPPPKQEKPWWKTLLGVGALVGVGLGAVAVATNERFREMAIDAGVWLGSLMVWDAIFHAAGRAITGLFD